MYLRIRTAIFLSTFLTLGTQATVADVIAAHPNDVMFLAGAASSVSVVTPSCNHSKPQNATLIIRARLTRLATDKRIISNLLKFGVRNITDKAPQLLSPCNGYKACGFRHCKVEAFFEVHHRENVIVRGRVRISRDGSLIPVVSIGQFNVVSKSGPDDQFSRIMKDEARLTEFSKSTDRGTKAEALFLLGMAAGRGSKKEKMFWQAASKLGHRGATLNLYWFSPTSDTLSRIWFNLSNGVKVAGGIFDGKPEQKELFDRGLRLKVGPYVAFKGMLSQRGMRLSGDRIVALGGIPPTREEMNLLVRRYFGRAIGKRVVASGALAKVFPLAPVGRCDQYWCYFKSGQTEQRFSLFLTTAPKCIAKGGVAYACEMQARNRVRIEMGDSSRPSAMLGGAGRGDRATARYAERLMNKKLREYPPFQLKGIFKREGSIWTAIGPITMITAGGEQFLLNGN
ncbi:MAG: hypothetical protein KDJ29_07470 [Hyphomicrobiales bacterium]|nr:hypothetical protein [Hyphomicrobiales bacterium]